jgi:hypothetical protein
MKGPDDKNLRETALRFGADRICLWRLCGNAGCLRCAGLVLDWLEALEEEKRARPSFAAIESQLETMEELRAYRAWRKALECLR